MSANGQPLLRAEGVRKYFPIKKGIVIQREIARVHAVDDVSFDIRAGETLGPRRRVRVRQVDARALHRPPARADRREDRVRGPRHLGPLA